jgi:uncharacterized protein (TIGR00297 family)
MTNNKVHNLFISITIALALLSTHIFWRYVIINNTTFICFSVSTLIGAWLCYSRQWLTLSGTLTALVFGYTSYACASSTHILALIFFLVMGSLLSKLNKQNSTSKIARNIQQVYANGIVPILLIIIYFITKQQLFETAYLAAIAISLTDTISSEMGKYYKQATWDIITWQPVSIGLSGGISIAGTLAGIIAVMLYAFGAKLLYVLTIQQVGIIIVVGVGGMLIDSILGSLWQAKYIQHNIINEHSGQLIKGYKWINNDAVNIISSLIGISLYLLMAICTKLI